MLEEQPAIEQDGQRMAVGDNRWLPYLAALQFGRHILWRSQHLGGHLIGNHQAIAVEDRRRPTQRIDKDILLREVRVAQAKRREARHSPRHLDWASQPPDPPSLLLRSQPGVR